MSLITAAHRIAGFFKREIVAPTKKIAGGGVAHRSPGTIQKGDEILRALVSDETGDISDDLIRLFEKKIELFKRVNHLSNPELVRKRVQAFLRYYGDNVYDGIVALTKELKMQEFSSELEPNFKLGGIANTALHLTFNSGHLKGRRVTFVIDDPVIDSQGKATVKNLKFWGQLPELPDFIAVKFSDTISPELTELFDLVIANFKTEYAKANPKLSSSIVKERERNL